MTVDLSSYTETGLRAIPFETRFCRDVATVEGVLLRRLKVHLDGRGEITELWSRPWVADGLIAPEHVYQSATDFGVVKAWHLHADHTDQFVVTRGKVQVAVADVREGSPSFGQANHFIVGVLNPCLIQIPPGVIHGMKALSPPEAIIVNLQSTIYDPADQATFPWDCVLADVWEPKNG